MKHVPQKLFQKQTNEHNSLISKFRCGYSHLMIYEYDFGDRKIIYASANFTRYEML